MLQTVYTKDLRDQRRGLTGWSIGLILLVVLMAALWPSIRDMPDLEVFLANYPEAMRELFNIDAIATGAGFLNAELYSIILPAMFLIFAIGRGARAVAGEEEQGTLEVLLVTPLSRLRVLAEKAGSLTTALVGLGVVLFLASWGSAVVVGMDIPVVDLAGAATAMVMLGLAHGFVALAIGSASGRRSWAIAGAAGLATAGYVLFVAAKLVSAVEPWEVLSPFYHALQGGPLGAGFAVNYLWLALLGLVAFLACLYRFDRRDIRA